jgi:hypothetical protein
MKKILPTLAAFTLTACASFHKKAAVSIVVATDHIADEVADDWQEQTKRAIEECREAAPPDADSEWRRECLSPYTPASTEELIVAVKTIVAVQLAVKAAAECEELGACLEDVDWNSLATQAKHAWASLKPFVLVTKSNTKVDPS